MTKKVPAVDLRGMKIKLQRPIHFNIRRHVLKVFTSISDKKSITIGQQHRKDDISVQIHF